MALTKLPGLPGFSYARVSSGDRRAIGKLTDTNHLESFHDTDPADYDRKIISLYTQSGLYANDFLNMINKSTPFGIEGNTDTWKWKIGIPYKFPKIIEIPEETAVQDKIGIDGKEFTFVADTDEFAKNSIISVGSKIHGPNLYIIKDPMVYNAGFLYTATLVAENPQSDFISKQYFVVGNELELVNGSIGEFDQDLLGLPRTGEELDMFETLGSAYGFEHKITGWADDKTPKNSKGQALDLLVFGKQERNELPVSQSLVRWEPFIEYQMRKAMMELKVKRAIWSKPGTTKSNGSKQEVKRTSAGVMYRMRRNGNYVGFNEGDFSAQLIRTVFGDLFYRRVDVKDRRVKLYTNEAGFDVFQQAIKEDAMASGLTLNAGSNDKFIQGSGQNLVYNWAFDSMITRETGKVELVHLKELDLPQTNQEFGQNKKSAPTFMVFNVSPNSDGSMVDNIREVRHKNRPSMTWGYIDGRRHHLGAMRSQGHSAANKFDGYEIFMDDRCDVFIEDLSRTVIMEQLPQVA